MGPLDFCPYDGKKINFNNLAYELVYSSGWNWKRIQEETVISTKSRTYIREDVNGRVVIQAGSRLDGKCGLDYLVEFLSSGKDLEDMSTEKSYESRIREMYSVRIRNPYLQQKNTENDFETDVPKRLHMVRQNQIPVFLDESENPVMYAVPCCPHCLKRLPAGWETADDYIGLSLRGGSGSGKTTFLYTLAHDYAAVFGETKFLNGHRFFISPAYYSDYILETENDILERNAAEMCCKNGICPPSGESVPLFLQAVLEDRSLRKRLIIGIYDTPAQMSPYRQLMSENCFQSGVAMKQLTEKLYADLFFFDSRKLSSLKNRRRSAAGGAQFVKCRMLTPDEQAGKQRDGKGMVIKASDLLRTKGKTVQNLTDESPETMELYHQMLRYGGSRLHEHMKHMRFVGILSKSDLLDMDEMDVRMLLEKNHCLKKEDLKMLRSDYGLGLSWHGVSALGCDAFENDHLLGEYKPFRAEEPVLFCIENRMRENGWL